MSDSAPMRNSDDVIRSTENIESADPEVLGAPVDELDDDDDEIELYLADFLKRHRIGVRAEQVGEGREVESEPDAPADATQPGQPSLPGVPLSASPILPPPVPDPPGPKVPSPEPTLSAPSLSEPAPSEPNDSDRPRRRALRHILRKPGQANKRTIPPESRDALRALRQLANSSARGALEKHSHRKMIHAMSRHLILGIAAMALSIYLAFRAHHVRSLTYLYAVAAFSAATISCVRYISLSFRPAQDMDEWPR